MPTPETTSAEALESYAVGTKTAAGSGPAWTNVNLTVLSLPPVANVFSMPAIAEPSIAWTTSGEAQAEERVENGPWIKSHLKTGSMYLTAAGAPYEFRWKTLSPDPFEVTIVVIGLPLFNEALEDVFGANASHARLQDVSGFEDAPLTSLLQQLKDEALKRVASRLFVRGVAQAIAVHLARNYTVLMQESHAEASLPGFKLRRVTDWMEAHMGEEFSLARLAAQAGMSEYYFNRLFKRATGVPPSRYQIKLRISAARRLLRETKKSVITIANEVGYSNPSHFAQVFRKEAGLSPSDYRRQR